MGNFWVQAQHLVQQQPAYGLPKNIVTVRGKENIIIETKNDYHQLIWNIYYVSEMKPVL